MYTAVHLPSIFQVDGACKDCLYAVACIGTSFSSACNLTLPEGESRDATLTFDPDNLIPGETYSFQVIT